MLEIIEFYIEMFHMDDEAKDVLAICWIAMIATILVCKFCILTTEAIMVIEQIQRWSVLIGLGAILITGAINSTKMIIETKNGER